MSIHTRLTPPDIPTAEFVCETCNTVFEVPGEIIRDATGQGFEPDDGSTTECPNDNGDDIHDVSMPNGQ